MRVDGTMHDDNAHRAALMTLLVLGIAGTAVAAGLAGSDRRGRAPMRRAADRAVVEPAGAEGEALQVSSGLWPNPMALTDLP
jgi:hypothetical protein